MRTSAVVIGAGHAGLAMSHRLTARGVDHVVLDRGRIGESWRSKRWPGLRLLTPNWMLGLPGQPAGQPDLDGYLTATDVALLVGAYAERVAAPVRTNVEVRTVRRVGHSYDVATDDGAWRADAVVLATGAAASPVVPGYAAGLSESIAQRTPFEYQGPASVPDGGVLIVGASATGVQLAAELRAAGRPVTLAVGEHVRLPRRYRGRDVFWWMHSTGTLDARHDEVDDLSRVRRLPSPQLIGSSVPVDLGSLVDAGVRLTGRLVGIDRDVARFSGSLRNVCALADLKMDRFLLRADEWATRSGFDAALEAPERFARTPVPNRPVLSLDLGADGIRTVVWATGFRPDHSWLGLPVFDRHGRIRHHGGVVADATGLYVLGLPMLRTRASTYIHGAAADTAVLADHLVTTLRA